MFSSRLRKALILILLVALAAGIAFYIYAAASGGPAGRFCVRQRALEATEVDVATKIAGRLSEVLPREGDMVAADGVVARLDADDLRARLRAFEAQVQQARGAAEEARAGQRKSSSDLTLAAASFRRSESLVARGFISIDKLDHDQTTLQGARAVVAQAKSKVGEADAAVTAAEAQVDESGGDAGRYLAQGADRRARAIPPGRAGRGAGGRRQGADPARPDRRLHDVFLPTNQAGRVALGAATRASSRPGAAVGDSVAVTFVAPQAQFTPARWRPGPSATS